MVVMDTCDYIKEAEQLSDVKYYKGVSTDLTAEHTARINTYLEGLTLKGEINNKVKRKLITTSSQTPHLYLLPKIHKGVTPPPGHPIDIVSANGCATEKISALTDMILRPLVPKTPSYIKDTGHFLQILRKMGNNRPPDTLLCTLDVSSLYTNIPNEEGRRAVAFWLSQYRPPSKIPIGEPSNSSILSLLKMVLDSRIFNLITITSSKSEEQPWAHV